MNIYIHTKIYDNLEGAWSYVIDRPNGISSQWGSSKQTINNNDLDILAVYKVCDAINCDNITKNIFIDSKYIINGITKYCEQWKNNNWLSANNKPIKNHDLWSIIYERTLEDIKISYISDELITNTKYQIAKLLNK